MDIVLKSKYLRILTVILLLQAALFYTVSHGDSRPLAKSLKEFPQTLPGWQMVSQGIVDDDTMKVLKADEALTRVYLKTPVPDLTHLTLEQKEFLSATAQDFFLVYFSTQQQGQSPHSPKNCLPGAGWQPIDTGEISVPVPGWDKPISVNKYVISKGDSQSLVLYWFQSHGRVVADEFSAKYYLVADSLRYHRSDTALVRVIVPIFHEDKATALNSATSFVQSAYPAVYHFLPM